MREKQGACLSAAFPLQNGATPLHLAAREGHAAKVEQLLAAGANTEAKDKVRGKVGVEDGEGSRGDTQLFLLSSLLVVF